MKIYVNFTAMWTYANKRGYVVCIRNNFIQTAVVIYIIKLLNCTQIECTFKNTGDCVTCIRYQIIQTAIIDFIIKIIKMYQNYHVNH